MASDVRQWQKIGRVFNRGPFAKIRALLVRLLDIRRHFQIYTQNNVPDLQYTVAYMAIWRSVVLFGHGLDEKIRHRNYIV